MLLRHCTSQAKANKKKLWCAFVYLSMWNLVKEKSICKQQRLQIGTNNNLAVPLNQSTGLWKWGPVIWDTGWKWHQLTESDQQNWNDWSVWSVARTKCVILQSFNITEKQEKGKVNDVTYYFTVFVVFTVGINWVLAGYLLALVHTNFQLKMRSRTESMMQGYMTKASTSRHQTTLMFISPEGWATL